MAEEVRNEALLGMHREVERQVSKLQVAAHVNVTGGGHAHDTNLKDGHRNYSKQLCNVHKVHIEVIERLVAELSLEFNYARRGDEVRGSREVLSEALGSGGELVGRSGHEASGCSKS
eukprot:Mycagemm_TRINITY_DN9980_c0_g1::TRINITY_DN9980_c0_g1_i1::g.3531::m.3531 type:complete len:117 gc:universal TRINITY_DN9980_c0_g1_i1:729-1079(+)